MPTLILHAFKVHSWEGVVCPFTTLERPGGFEPPEINGLQPFPLSCWVWTQIGSNWLKLAQEEGIEPSHSLHICTRELLL
jgi:hypothetical protein